MVKQNSQSRQLLSSLRTESVETENISQPAPFASGGKAGVRGKKKTAEAVSSGESFALGEGKAKSSIVGIEVFHLDYVKACIC